MNLKIEQIGPLTFRISGVVENLKTERFWQNPVLLLNHSTPIGKCVGEAKGVLEIQLNEGFELPDSFGLGFSLDQDHYVKEFSIVTKAESLKPKPTSPEIDEQE